MLLAAIDVGSNSIHMVIASALDAAAFEIVDREREVVQIGRGSFRSGVLDPEAIARTVGALQRFVELARRHRVDDIICTATAAVREAANGGEFLAAARDSCGIEPRVIPAAEEGRLIYLGVKSALNLPVGAVSILDIGGGSIQIVVGNRERCIKPLSAPLGALRLTERYLRADPPKPRQLERLEERIRNGAEEALSVARKYRLRRIYGSSGSIHALAHVAHWLEHDEPLEQINGHELTLKSLRRVTERLTGMTLAEREQLKGIDSQRAGIIVPGALVLVHLLEGLDADAITLSDYGVREGLVTDYLQRHAREITILSRIEDLRQRSVLQCLARFGIEPEHPRHVAKLALELFDGTARFHQLDRVARETLYFAAMLHDVGAAIGYSSHEVHSEYIIRNANLRGFSPEELAQIANVARYHGKSSPGKNDSTFRTLRKKERRRVRWLAAVLRIAERLDRSHYQLVRSLKVGVGKRLVIRVDAGPEAQLEIWAARQRSRLLARQLDIPVVIERTPGARGRRRVLPHRPERRRSRSNRAGSARDARVRAALRATPTRGARRRGPGKT